MVEPQSSRFWQDVLRLRIVEESDLREAWNAISPEKRTADAIDRRLARQLIQTGRLTMWQAQQIYSVRNPLVRIDQYVLLDTVGKGGMGRVYRARDTKLGRIVAIKTMTAERMTNERAISRFQREILASALLEHESLVRIYDGGRSGEGLMYLAMEYIEGKSAGHVIQENGRMPPAQAVRLCREVALGLEHARRKGLIHRDVHPWNILITDRGSAKLTDLGLAISQENLLEGAASVTRDGVTVGNFDYLSPEQAKDSHNVDTRSDIYSLGCTLYHMIAGRVPFLEESLTAKLIAHQEQEPAPLDAIVPGLPAGLVQAIRKMMAKGREERYATPEEVAQALAPFVDERLYAGRDADAFAEPPGASASRSHSQDRLEAELKSESGSGSHSQELSSVSLPEKENGPKRPGSPASSAANPTPAPISPLFTIRTEEDEDASPHAGGPAKRLSTKEAPPRSGSKTVPKPIPEAAPPASPPSRLSPDRNPSPSSNGGNGLFTIKTDDDEPAPPKPKAPTPAPPPPSSAPPAPAPASASAPPRSRSVPPPIPAAAPTPSAPPQAPDNPFGLRFDDPPASSSPAAGKPAKPTPAPKPKPEPENDGENDGADGDDEFESAAVSPIALKLKDPGTWLMIGSAVIFLLIGCAVAYMFLFQNQGGSPKKPRTVASTTTAKPEPKTDASPDATADPSNANAQPETAKSEGAMTKDEPKTSATEPAATVKADAVPPPEVKPAPTGPKLIMTRAARRFNPVDFKDAMERIANNRSEILMPPVYEFEVASPIEGIVNDARVTIRPAKRGQRAVFKLKLREKTLLQFGSGCEVSFQDIDFQIEPADSSAALFDYLDNKPVEFSNCTFAGRAQESLLQKK